MDNRLPLTDCVSLADNLAGLLTPAIQPLPNRFTDSWDYVQTGNNLVHPIIWGLVVEAVRCLPGVSFVGIDVRLNNGRGAKFQPDIVAFDTGLVPTLFVDYESPNSSDARVPVKDIKGYYDWAANRDESIRLVPYIIVTTLPDVESPDWELRYYSPGQCNEVFCGRRDELRKNPFRFWYEHCRPEFDKPQMANIAVLNIDRNQVKRVHPR